MTWTLHTIGLLPGGTFNDANACSSDGSIVVGGGDTSGFTQRAWSWTSGGGFTLLALLPGGSASTAAACSADGLKIVGECTDSLGQARAVLWISGVISDLGTLGTGNQAEAFAISSDGTHVGGASLVLPTPPNPFVTHPFIWTSGGGMTDIGVFGTNGSGTVACLSSNGSFAAGYGDSPDVPWKYNGSLSAIPLLAGATNGSARACDAAGDAVVGFMGGSVTLPFRWTSGGGTVQIPLPGSDTTGEGFGLSADGNTACGLSSTGGAPHAWVWRNGVGTSFLPTTAGAVYAVAIAVSGDGATIVGTELESGGAQNAVYWTLDIAAPILSVGSPTTTSLTASWTPGAGTSPTSYLLEYRLYPAGSWNQIDGIASLSRVVSGLAAATEYDFRVLAHTPDGDSPFSSIVSASTLSVTPAVVAPLGLGRWRGQCGINWKGMALIGDAYTNVVGLSDFSVFTEYGNQMRMLVTTPTIQSARKRVFVPLLEIEVEAGLGEPGDPSAAPVMMLDYSKDGGVTWVPLQMFRSMGAAGEYLKRLRWVNLGNARQWIFRFQYTGSARPSIIGTYIDSYLGLG